jgi:hypothetical protein
MQKLQPQILREVEDLANQIVNTETSIQIARLAAADLGLGSNGAFNLLRKHLVLAYCQGYVLGRRASKTRIILPPVADLHKQS